MLAGFPNWHVLEQVGWGTRPQLVHPGCPDDARLWWDQPLLGWHRYRHSTKSGRWLLTICVELFCHNLLWDYVTCFSSKKKWRFFITVTSPVQSGWPRLWSGIQQLKGTDKKVRVSYYYNFHKNASQLPGCWCWFQRKDWQPRRSWLTHGLPLTTKQLSLAGGELRIVLELELSGCRTPCHFQSDSIGDFSHAPPSCSLEVDGHQKVHSGFLIEDYLEYLLNVDRLSSRYSRPWRCSSRRRKPTRVRSRRCFSPQTTHSSSSSRFIRKQDNIGWM